MFLLEKNYIRFWYKNIKSLFGIYCSVDDNMVKDVIEMG